MKTASKLLLAAVWSIKHDVPQRVACCATELFKEPTFSNIFFGDLTFALWADHGGASCLSK